MRTACLLRLQADRRVRLHPGVVDRSEALDELLGLQVELANKGARNTPEQATLIDLPIQPASTSTSSFESGCLTAPFLGPTRTSVRAF